MYMMSCMTNLLREIKTLQQQQKCETVGQNVESSVRNSYQKETRFQTECIETMVGIEQTVIGFKAGKDGYHVVGAWPYAAAHEG